MTIMNKVTKVPVTFRSMLQRLNRRLALDGKELRSARGRQAKKMFGDYVVIDVKTGTSEKADPVKLARETGALRDWEEVT
jgi:hypothetical protein